MSFLSSLGSVVELVEQWKQTKTVEHANFTYAAIYSFSSKHESCKLQLKHFHTSRVPNCLWNINTCETWEVTFALHQLNRTPVQMKTFNRAILLFPGQCIMAYLTISAVHSHVSGNSLRTYTDFVLACWLLVSWLMMPPLRRGAAGPIIYFSILFVRVPLSISLTLWILPT